MGREQDFCEIARQLTGGGFKLKDEWKSLDVFPVCVYNNTSFTKKQDFSISSAVLMCYTIAESRTVIVLYFS